MQLDAMVRAYQRWSYEIRNDGLDACLERATSSESDTGLCEGTADIVVLDTYRKSLYCTITSRSRSTLTGTFKTSYTMFQDDESIAAALVRQGMIPCAPFNPEYAISIRTLEIFRNLRNRCPHLAIQPYVKGLLDLQGVGPSFLHWPIC